MCVAMPDPTKPRAKIVIEPRGGDLSPLRPRLRPFCHTCGWRKGGLDSWDGNACKCGYRALPMAMTGEQNYDVLLTSAVSRLHARRDPLDKTRWVYFAKESESTWSVTTEAMLQLGLMPETAEAYYKWAQADETAIERGNGRRW